MILHTVSPDSKTDAPDEGLIADALRLLYAGKLDAVILVADEGQNRFMQMGQGGGHIEHCVGRKGPIYSAENVPLDLATRMFASYRNGDDGWQSAVSWVVEIEEL